MSRMFQEVADGDDGRNRTSADGNDACDFFKCRRTSCVCSPSHRHTHPLTHSYPRRPRATSAGGFGQVTGPGSFNMSVAHHDVYSAYFMVCSQDVKFYGDVTSTFINLDPEGGLTQHLPIELAMLPAIYSVSAAVLLPRLFTAVRAVVFVCVFVFSRSRSEFYARAVISNGRTYSSTVAHASGTSRLLYTVFNK